MQAGPIRTRRVRAATPASSAIDSMRGLPSRLSPTQTEANWPEPSAISAIWSICSGVVAPNSTPRFGKVNPIFIVLRPLRPPRPGSSGRRGAIRRRAPPESPGGSSRRGRPVEHDRVRTGSPHRQPVRHRAVARRFVHLDPMRPDLESGDTRPLIE